MTKNNINRSSKKCHINYGINREFDFKQNGIAKKNICGEP